MRFGLSVMVAVAALSIQVGCTAGAGAPAESSEIGTQSSPITFETRKDLPACSDAMSALYAYIQDEHVEVGCANGAWSEPAQSN